MAQNARQSVVSLREFVCFVFHDTVMKAKSPDIAIERCLKGRKKPFTE